MACDWWSHADDGKPGRLPMITEANTGTHWETVQWVCAVKMTWHQQPRLCWTLRVYPSTAEVTLSLGALTERAA